MAVSDTNIKELEGYYVIRGYNDGMGFSAITDLPRDKAVAVMEKSGMSRGKGEAGPDGTRDRGVYYDDRKATDQWVRAQAGITEGRENPVFFAVTKDPQYLKELLAKGYDNVMVAPLSKLDITQWSFTMDDSMGNYFSNKHGSDKHPDTKNFLFDSNPLHGKVMNAMQAAAAMEKYPTYPNGQPRAFEAQYWGPAFNPEDVGGKDYKHTASRFAGLEKKTAAAAQPQKVAPQFPKPKH